MRIGIIMTIGTMVGTMAVAQGDVRPRLEEFTSTAPDWARDCSVDLVALDQTAFSVAVACRGSEELVFERRPKTSRVANGSITTFDGSTRVHAWRTTRFSTDVYACTSTAERDAGARCKALVNAFAGSTIVRRGTAAFARPKS